MIRIVIIVGIVGIVAQPWLPGSLGRTNFCFLIALISRSNAGLLNRLVDGLSSSRNGVPVRNAMVHEGHRIEADPERIPGIMSIRRREPAVEFVHEVARLGLAPDLHDVTHLVGRGWLELDIIPGLLFSAVKPLHGA